MITGTCHDAQMIPLISATPGNDVTFASCGTKNPRQPSSSPTAEMQEPSTPTVAMIRKNTSNAAIGGICGNFCDIFCNTEPCKSKYPANHTGKYTAHAYT